ncbi:marR family protein [Acinetobacter baumannii 1457504]|nr:marR family protein [Acinetobacter baumannii 1457504]
MSEISLDNFDYAILRILQKDNKTSHREISEKIGLSAASVQRRITRMEEKEIILKNCAILNPLKFGEKLLPLLRSALAKIVQ